MTAILTREMTVGKIDIQHDRTLIFPDNENRISYHVIATKKQSEGLKVGDKILYRPEGVNFGWFVEKIGESK